MPNHAPTFLLLTACGLAAAPAQQPAEPQWPGPQAPTLHATADGSLVGEGTSFVATFDARGAELVVGNPMSDQPPVGLRVRLADIGRGGARAPVARARVEPGDADTAHYARTGILERYRVTADGFEQSFVLDQRPPGTGDLVLGIEVAAPALHAPATEAAHRPIDFSCAGRDVVRYGEAFVYARGGAPLPIASRYDGGGRIELVVPGALLDGASYPVVIDPVVGPLLEPGSTGWNDSLPDVAFDPLSSTYMVVWQRQFGANDVRIRARRYRQDGVSLGGVIDVTYQGFYGWPTVAAGRTAAGAGRFLIVWSSSLGLRGRLYESATGTAIGGGPFALTNVAASVRDRRPAVSFGYTDWVLAWDRTPGGAAEPNEVRVCRLTQSTGSGLVAGPEQVVETVSSGYVRRPRMARRHLFQGGPLVRLVWERFYTSPAPGDTDLRTGYFSVGSSLSFLQGPGTVPGANGIGVDERRHDVAAIDDPLNPNHLVVWDEDGDIKGQRYVGNVPVGGEIQLSVGAADSAPAVGAGSTEFNVAYRRAVSPTEDRVLAARVLGDGTVAAVDREVGQGAGWQLSELRASSTFLSANPAVSNMSMLAWWLESTSGGPQNDILSRRVATVGPSTIPFGTGCAGPGGQLPLIQAIGEPYPGNGQFAFRLTNAPPNSICALLASDQFTSTPLAGAPGCTLYAGVPLVAVLPTLTNGVGQATLPLPIPLGVPPGAELAFQWAIHTPGYNALGWIASDDLDVYWRQ